MTSETFLQLSDLLPEPTLLVSPTGLVLAANRAVRERLGLSPDTLCGKPLAGVLADPSEKVASYLRLCSQSRQLVFGSLALAGANLLACRAEGAALRPEADEALQILLRLLPEKSSGKELATLNQKIEELNQEIERRKQAGEHARRQEEWLRVTVSSIGDAVIATDAEGAVTFMNGVAERLTGWSQAEAQGRPLPEVFNIVNELTREPAQNPALRALQEGRVVGLANHTILISRDGTERPIDDSAAPMRDRGTVGAVLVFRDVSERRKAERERSRLAAIVESSDDAIVSKSLEGIIQTWNASAERLFGYTADEAIGKPITIIIPRERLDEEREILSRLRRGVRIDHFETVRVAKDGRQLDISLTVSPIRDAGGRVVGASKVARDITEKKRAEADLARLTAESERQRRMFDTALSHTVDFVYLFDTTGRFTYANKSLLDLWDKNLEQVIGRNFFELGYPHDLAARLQAQIREVIETKRSLRDESPYTSVLGTRSYEYIFVPVVGTNGEVEAVAGSTRDITERKRNEEDLREADQRKDEFIALLAHELRNPLAPIRNGLEVIRMSPNRTVRERSQAMMDRQLTHMVRLVDDLLDMSRVSRNKMELRRSRVTLADAIHAAVETAGPAVEEGGHELTVSLPRAPIYLDADLTRLAQVFGNLLTNSAKYTPRGGKIWLSAERRGSEAVVSVRDTGIGIPPRFLPRIFDMFSQVERSVERETGGLGIGLALVKGLVEMHGGSVAAESEGPGKGSTFTVRLPVAEHTEPNASPADVNRVKSGSRRVLVVDDNRDGAESMAEMLRLLGNEVTTAHNGLEAIRLAEEFRPDVILMDVGMPRLNGLDATRRIRAEPWGQDTRIIALTGWGQEGDREQSREAGCNGHLVKPVNLIDLEKLLAEEKR